MALSYISDRRMGVECTKTLVYALAAAFPAHMIAAATCSGHQPIGSNRPIRLSSER